MLCDLDTFCCADNMFTEAICQTCMFNVLKRGFHTGKTLNTARSTMATAATKKLVQAIFQSRYMHQCSRHAAQDIEGRHTRVVVPNLFALDKRSLVDKQSNKNHGWRELEAKGFAKRSTKNSFQQVKKVQLTHGIIERLSMCQSLTPKRCNKEINQTRSNK